MAPALYSGRADWPSRCGMAPHARARSGRFGNGVSRMQHFPKNLAPELICRAPPAPLSSCYYYLMSLHCPQIPNLNTPTKKKLIALTRSAILLVLAMRSSWSRGVGYVARAAGAEKTKKTGCSSGQTMVHTPALGRHSCRVAVNVIVRLAGARGRNERDSKKSIIQSLAPMRRTDEFVLHRQNAELC